MPSVYPFRAVHYAGPEGGGDVSRLIAPPYDVLDAAGKQRLLERDPRNIVAIDLPHLPVNRVGPPEAYKSAAATMHNWLAQGVLAKSAAPAMYVYRQSFTTAGRTFQRTGMACTVETRPFGARAGGGILPHEETFSGPKEDRLALMKATKAQLSPVFGLHADDGGKATRVLQGVMASRPSDITADMGDGVKHEVWISRDGPTIEAYQAALAGEDIFIADGHHRYTTSFNYLKHLETQGAVAADHPARRSLMVLVGMHDPGLAIWPTHRVLGGMSGYSWPAFGAASAGQLRFESLRGGLRELESALNARNTSTDNTMGFYDFATKSCFIGHPTQADPLAAQHSYKPDAWRRLDVAIVQHLIVEEICQPSLNEGGGVQWAFPHTIAEVEAIGAGRQTGAGGGAGFTPQLGIILRPTPLEAVREICRAGELMPQKSTFFYPKLATGLFINPLE